GRVTVPAFRAPFVDKVLSESRALGYTRDEATRALLKAVKTVEDSEFELPDTLQGTLRGYQRTGFRWLRTMEHFGFGGILADDMGLGKTVQMITLLLDAKKRGVTLPSLVVCPASLVLNWQSEIRRFAPSLPVRAIVGDSAAREALLQDLEPGTVLITSYDLLKRDAALYADLSFHYHVLDEAQYIKNHATQNARTVKGIRSVQRFALTGTPVENRLSELWSIFDFLMPGFLFSYPRFRERFELPAVRDGDREALAALARLCAPFLLRRLKKDVLQELPPKTETVRCIPLEETQRKTYLAAALRMREELQSRTAEGPTRLQALTMLTRLRQICCDPTLCYDNYRGGSAKLENCLELVKEAVEGGHRVLLFSQFTSMLAILETRLREAGIDFYTLQGSTPREKRAAMVEEFNSEGGAPVFLISLKAGGTGLNLTAADVVIHYDPWWNVSVQNQAADRAHRIGQQRPVQVFKLIAEGTVEEKILRLQEAKQSLADAVVRADGLSLSALSDEEILVLLMP
ncbi:MAG: ATP-dependent helicase, partial [Clostridia bacterium]|nr:ATP-dependent helicase [Clostridia bacterium]